MNWNDLSEAQRAVLNEFVAACEAAGWDATSWHEVVQRGTPTSPEGHAERSTLAAQVTLEVDLARHTLRLLMMAHGALDPVSCTCALREDGSDAVEMTAHVLETDPLALETFPDLMKAWVAQVGEERVSVSIGPRPVEVSDILAGEVDLASLVRSFSVLYDRGIAALDAARWKEATRLFARVTEIRPEFAEAWHNLGWSRLHHGHTEEGHSALERAVALYEARVEQDAEDADALFWSASALAQLERLDEAMARLERAIALEPSYRGEALSEPDFAPLHARLRGQS